MGQGYIPLWNANSRYKSVTPSHGTIARRWGGFEAATRYCDTARYETLMRPTRPVHHGWNAAHSNEIVVVFSVLLPEHPRPPL
jgi:hypothetical protein